LAKAGRSRAELQLVGAPFLVTGNTEEEFAQVRLAAVNQIAFYGSTPAYRGVLESVGYGELQGELNALSKQGKWLEMGQCIDDALLEKIAIVGEPAEVAAKLTRRYGDIFDITQAMVFSGDAYSAGVFNTEITAAIRQAAN
jgi:alkanesulfonate monooxygenase SsuD/methylene tetrahydromethanopterin reductase-like flavin-dependent oxidoreductase (luciferase family)